MDYCKKSKFILLPLVTLQIYWLYTYTLQSPEALQWGSWTYSEWLINYGAGFIRRGLVGEFISRWMPGNEVIATNAIVFFASGMSCLALCNLLYQNKRISGLVSVAIFLMPGALLHGLASNQIFFRKEILYAFPIFICGSALQLYLRNRSSIWRKNILMFSLICSSVLAGICVLVHEAFVLIAFPLCFWLWSDTLQQVATKNKNRLFLIILSAPTVLAAAASVIYRCNWDQAQQLWLALSEKNRLLITEGTTLPIEPIKAIGSLGSPYFWDHVVYINFIHITKSEGVLWCLVILFTLCCLAMLFKLLYTSESQIKESAILLYRGRIYFFIVLPILLISDVGRWAGCACSLTILYWVACSGVARSTTDCKTDPAALKFLDGFKEIQLFTLIIGSNILFTIPALFTDRLLLRNGNILKAILGLFLF